ncbi:hypothetical protein SF83666_b58310 (plasmid) [Sinorhizobium fredii CCBAU 83666]|nr:hypothetical protein SF83666_b58310 [Sinorhizobium fredii CCBAU 83666]
MLIAMTLRVRLHCLQRSLDPERLQSFENFLRDGPIDAHATEPDAVSSRHVAECTATNVSLRVAAFPRILNMQSATAATATK